MGLITSTHWSELSKKDKDTIIFLYVNYISNEYNKGNIEINIPYIINIDNINNVVTDKKFINELLELSEIKYKRFYLSPVSCNIELYWIIELF